MKVHPFFRPKSPFSNWHRSEFSAICLSGYIQKYNCVEQYMMHQKALLFRDLEVAKQVLKTNNPKDQKALGRKVRDFDETVWLIHARQIVRDGLAAKFKQNKDLKQVLLDTEGSVLVEASPYDLIWGIGLDENSPHVTNMSMWKGLNWLGFLLTDLRLEIERIEKR